MHWKVILLNFSIPESFGMLCLLLYLHYYFSWVVKTVKYAKQVKPIDYGLVFLPISPLWKAWHLFSFYIWDDWNLVYHLYLQLSWRSSLYFVRIYEDFPSFFLFFLPSVLSIINLDLNSCNGDIWKAFTLECCAAFEWFCILVSIQATNSISNWSQLSKDLKKKKRRKKKP